METNQRISYGIAICIAVFLLANVLGSRIYFANSLILPSFTTHAFMLLLTLLSIYTCRSLLQLRIAAPDSKELLKAILLGLVAPIALGLLTNLLSLILTGNAQTGHPLFNHASTMQFFLSTFLLASIAEELLFRGFLLNMLKPLKAKALSLGKIRISLSVFISALTFSLAHLVLLSSGIDWVSLSRILLSTFILGLIAGYYQEKHENLLYAIAAHMAFNFLGLLALLVLAK